MPHLRIKDFSCIDDADVKLARITILIGPQASGKSVISKLMHFFHESINDIYGFDVEYEVRDLVSYQDKVLKNFEKSFPSSAWGPKAFEISFYTGPFSIRIWRYKPRKGSTGRLHLEFSSQLVELYNNIQAEIVIAKEKSEKRREEDNIIGREWDYVWKVYQASQTRIQKILEDDFVRTQFFVPAGRSFFTSMGKAVVAFEHLGSLDPFTISFGKYFLAMRDHWGTRRFSYRTRSEKTQKEIVSLREKLSQQLFSGTIKIDRNEEYIESSDGRKIPFAIMSSGQQELLPLWLTINEYMDGSLPYTLVYIEEPEAHLFPSAQGALTEYLSILLGTAPGQKMLITTHSPYILAKINNLLKAGSIAGKTPKKDQTAIESIVPRQAWLRPKTTSAYAIIDRKVVSIMDEGGLIDGEYLDQVSGDISVDFNKLLEIEYAR